MHITHVVGTRPNFPKCAPVERALAKTGFKQMIVHSGQHYDPAMSQEMTDDTGCPIDVILTNDIPAIKTWLAANPTDLVMVYGDCDTAANATIAAYTLRMKIAHVEAGLRCGDPSMKEEINRKLIDHMADILYAPSVDAIYNLGKENIAFNKIVFVGNVMVDSWRWKFGYDRPDREMFGLVTMHRPENVDDPKFMKNLMIALEELDYPLVFPVHPRVTIPNNRAVNVEISSPLRYQTFGTMLRKAQFIITDSGGVQEEATITGTPCLTLRPSTERPVTITEGTNELATLHSLEEQVDRILDGKWKQGSIPMLWDGMSGERIAWHLKSA